MGTLLSLFWKIKLRYKSMTGEVTNFLSKEYSTFSYLGKSFLFFVGAVVGIRVPKVFEAAQFLHED